MELAIAEPLNGFDELRKLPLEPFEFCQKWVKKKYGERGWYTASCRALAEATGFSVRSVQGWGKKFEDYPPLVAHILRKEDLLNEVRKALDPPPEYLDE